MGLTVKKKFAAVFVTVASRVVELLRNAFVNNVHINALDISIAIKNPILVKRIT